MRRVSRLVCLGFVLGVPMWAQDASQAASKPPMALLFKNVWRITKADRQPFQGSIYIFLPNGTLLETSCGEPYRIALWSRDSQDPSTLRITEDQRVVATWKITELTSATLRLEKKLPRSEESRKKH
ncbi:MAG TPA: hypothetical protein VKH40_09260 [Alloacidobacterium sp.]|nr:hypothetical protein [Alloacidobacterium sp.]